MSAVLVVAACIALNAALAALEIAFVSASKADIRAHAQAGDVRAWHLLRLRETPERTLSAIQVGITLVSLLSGAVGGAGAQEFVSPFLQQRLALGGGPATVLAIAIVAIPLMFMTVVVGELVPKALALRHPEHIALTAARGLQLLERAFLPIVSVLAWATNTLVTRIPREPFGRGREGHPGTIQQHYALDLVDLARRRVREAMVPWSQTVTADASMVPQSLVDLALASGHTRLPILRSGEVSGVLHTKELLTFFAAGERDWRTLVRPAVTVGPDDALLTVLRLLQNRRSHMGIVQGAEGAPMGIVTLEDILEEVLGELYDEDDDRAVARLLAARGKLTHAVTHRGQPSLTTATKRAPKEQPRTRSRGS
jgi:putative hemolysin